MSCTLSAWNTSLCARKRRQWWTFVSILCFVVVALWAFLIAYLVTPPGESLLNRQVLVKDPEGKEHLLLIKECFCKERKLISKQQHIDIFDMETKKWIHEGTDGILFIPCFHKKHAGYLMRYNPAHQTYCHLMYCKTHVDKLQDTWEPRHYFLQEFFAWLGIQKRTHQYEFEPI